MNAAMYVYALAYEYIKGKYGVIGINFAYSVKQDKETTT
jgi:hypothetical protein